MDLQRELIGRTHELAPVLAARAAATEANRAPLDDNVRQLCDAGLMQILVPRRYGGHELHVDTLVEIVRIVASACPSTGWVTAFYIGHNWFHAVFPRASQDEVFADRPYALTAGQIAPSMRAERDTGGYRLSGRQSWSSGVVHANWIIFTGMVSDDPGQGPRLFCVPRAEVEVVDNWYIAGMCGTGSRDVAVDGVFVPVHHTLSFADFLNGSHHGGAVHGTALYRLPALGVIWFEVMPVMAGILRGAAECFRDLTAARANAYTGEASATRPAAQMRVGRGLANADALDDLTRSAARHVLAWDGSSAITLETRAAFRARAALVTKLAADGVTDIVNGAGGNAFRSEAPLQRYFRDVNVLRTHAALDYEGAMEVYGRLGLGQEPGSPLL
ncbi:MAG: acyl-CoA dehydrogenase family protein [Gammaproteobacteria bacterium]|nr:acyl-CoA dehydrogenase family protein [Gammaproteobacteria bacterium]